MSSSNITITITVQPEEESGVTLKRGKGESSQRSEHGLPMPPESEAAGISADEGISSSVGAPAPPLDTHREQDLVTDQPASPPSFADQDTAVSSVTAAAGPTPPTQHPDIPEENEEAGGNGSSTTPSPPRDEDDEKGKSGSGSKKKK
ncbi:MAG: hypothetical protein R3281_08925 [Balneolaceae bacterium]|nr:hypothetical protein [Balneolaceae bacterium]